MKTLTLHPIWKDFDQREGGMEVYSFTPDHLPWLLRGEYKFLRKEGASRRVARWHVHRMIAMLHNGNRWTVELPMSAEVDALTDEDYEAAMEDEYPW